MVSSPARVGAVSYLNARPLYYRLCEFAPDIILTMEVPSRLAEQLAAGALDLALIPSVEYLRGAERGYEILPGFAIAAQRPRAECEALQPGAAGADRETGDG